MSIADRDPLACMVVLGCVRMPYFGVMGGYLTASSIRWRQCVTFRLRSTMRTQGE